MTIRLMTMTVAFLTATTSTLVLADDPPKVVDIVNQVEGQTTILAIVPHGSRIKKGEVLIELDSAPLRDKLTDQQINVVQAKAAFENAKKALEVAAVTAQEIQEGTEEEIKATENAVRIAELDIKIAQTAVDQAKAKIATEGERANYDKALANLARAATTLNRAKGKLKSLKEITAPKRKLESDLNVGKAQTELKANDGIHQLEMGKLDKLRKMIELCTIKSPRDGRVMYANPDPPRADGYQIEEGALVREKQTIVRVVPE
jgi:HlyD family secretion protein